jgi:hypothetical protein
VTAKKDPPPDPVALQFADVPTTEFLVESALPNGEKHMTPVQRAIAKAADGFPLGDLWKFKDVKRAFGGKKPAPVQPKTLVFLAGTRGAKSIFAAAKGTRSSLLCDLSGCSPGDEIRMPCLATTEVQAGYIYSHALSIFQRTPGLRQALVGKPLKGSFRVAREGGHEVSIETLAMSSKGNNLVGSWLAGVVFDEAPRMGSEEETVRSLKSGRDAAADRILMRGQELLIGSPHAPYGEVYELWREFFGHPNEEIVVVQASGPMLNPFHWTAERLDVLAKTNPFTYVTSGLGQFADPESSLIPSPAIAACMSSEERHPRKMVTKTIDVEYVASLAPGERGAGWTLVVLGTTGRDADGQLLYEEAVAQQWFGTALEALEPRRVLREVRDILLGYGVDVVHVKDLFVSGLHDIAESLGLALNADRMELEERLEFCELLRGAIVEKRLRLTSNRQQYTDLQRVQRKPTVNGTTVHYPSSGDETACDFVPPLGVCLLLAPPPPNIPVDVERDALDEIFHRLKTAADPWEAACR